MSLPGPLRRTRICGENGDAQYGVFWGAVFMLVLDVSAWSVAGDGMKRCLRKARTAASFVPGG